MEARLIFRVFSLFKLQSIVSPRMFEQNIADLFGVSVYYLLLNVPEQFHYLSQKHLNVTSSSSVPTFCNFSESKLILDSN